MRKLRLAAIVLLAVITVAAIAGCAGTGAKEDTLERPVKVLTLMGPTGMGMAKIMNDSEAGSSALQYDFTVASAPDQIAASVIKGEYDIAAVPVNLASVLYNKTNQALYVAAVNTLGVLYILDNGNGVSTLEDLRGKTLYATGQGSNPEYTLRYILQKNNIDPDKDLTIEYLAEHAELATKMVAGQATLGMLPEPNVTSVTINNPDVKIAIDLTQEWEKATGVKLAQGCIIVNKQFADEHPGILQKFLDEYRASVNFVNTDPDSASQMIEKAGIVPKAAIAKKAIPNCNIVLITGQEMKTMVGDMLKVLYDANASSVGGKLPQDSFYYLSAK